jgi:hypothetical protein
MAKTCKYTQQQMVDALVSTKGMVYLSAQRLGCTLETVMNYYKRYPAVEQAKHDARGTLLDDCELRLWKAVQRDEAWAIAFALKTVGRSRGYGERLDLNVSIKAAAEKVAAEFGLSPEAILAEATLLLSEVESNGA